MDPALVADIVVVLHLGFALFVVGGFAALGAGWLRRWRWIRGRRWRLLHLGCIWLVALEAVWGLVCPLTLLEQRLRENAGLAVARGSFMGRIAHTLLFYSFPTWVFTLSYALLAVLGLVLWWAIPPRVRPGQRGQP